MSTIEDDDDYQHSDEDEDVYYMEDDQDEAESLTPTYDSDGDFNTGAEGAVRRRAQYEVLTGSMLQERQNEAIQQVTNILGISPDDAARLLHQYKWDANRVNEEWWADMDAVRQKVGLLDEAPCTAAPQRKAAKATCSICFEEYKTKEMQSAGCGHFFCWNCWRGYISTAIRDGHPVLSLRCPNPECQIAVPQNVFSKICTEAESQRYGALSLESFVVDSSRMVFCPGPDCNNAIESAQELHGEALDVYCSCGNVFCFTCQEEAHRPVDCETIKKWLIKNSAESENLTWIIANTKPCPKCKRAIEKNQGCMHMTCSQCRHQFCWLCLADWSTHGADTGGYYSCNRYDQAVRKGEINEADIKRENAKQALERYMHYYERWSENEKAKVAASTKMANIDRSELATFSELYKMPTSDMKYITDACLQIVDCRRILKWTYAFGFYNFDATIDRGLKEDVLKQQKEFFEFIQGEAEKYLDKLHDMIENELGTFKPQENSTPKTQEEWQDFRLRIVGTTELVKSHFHKLVEELEKGMDNMLTAYTEPLKEEGSMSDAIQPESVAAESATKGKKKASRAKKRGAPAASAQSGASSQARNKSANASAGASATMRGIERTLGFWQCQTCTFANTDLEADECEICLAPRDGSQQ